MCVYIATVQVAVLRAWHLCIEGTCSPAAQQAHVESLVDGTYSGGWVLPSALPCAEPG
jgi:hypothetical protein